MTDVTNSAEAQMVHFSQQPLLKLGIPFSSTISGTQTNQKIVSKEMSRKNLIEVTSCQCKLSKGEHMEGNILPSSL